MLKLFRRKFVKYICIKGKKKAPRKQEAGEYLLNFDSFVEFKYWRKTDNGLFNLFDVFLCLLLLLRMRK